jgi:hypothetical protein
VVAKASSNREITFNSSPTTDQSLLFFVAERQSVLSVIVLLMLLLFYDFTVIPCSKHFALAKRNLSTEGALRWIPHQHVESHIE